MEDENFFTRKRKEREATLAKEKVAQRIVQNQSNPASQVTFTEWKNNSEYHTLGQDFQTKRELKYRLGLRYTTPGLDSLEKSSVESDLRQVTNEVIVLMQKITEKFPDSPLAKQILSEK